MRHWKNGGVLVSTGGGCMSHTCSGAGPDEILKALLLWTIVISVPVHKAVAGRSMSNEGGEHG
jgi:hypothetical protein